MHFKTILTLLFFYATAVVAQPDVDPNTPLQQQNLNTAENTKTKLGVKFTMGLHKFRGTAFDDPRLMYGFGMGFYNIIHLNKSKSLNLHWEFDFSFKGSKFNKPNDTSYSKISLSYMELPVYLSVKLLDTKKKLPLHALIGGQFGVLFRSTINKAYGKFGEVKTNLPFKPFDFMPVVGVRKEIGSGMSLQFCAKMGLINIWTNKFYERRVNPDPDPGQKNYDYSDLTPGFKDGTHTVKNLSFELSLLF